jgi:hypothetical protein
MQPLVYNANGPLGGGAYSYIRLLPDGFLLKAIAFRVCEHEYMNIHPVPQLSLLAPALRPCMHNMGFLCGTTTLF